MSNKNIPFGIKFPERLAELRLNAGFKSQNNFARRCNIPQPTYQRYESGERFPTAENIHKIAGILGVTIDYLMTGREENPAVSIPEKFSKKFRVLGVVGASVTYAGLPVDLGEVECSDCYILKVHDDSMAPVVWDGQCVVVDPSAKVRSGDLVVAEVEGGWVFKRYLRADKGEHQLISLNTQGSFTAFVFEKKPPPMRRVVGVFFK
jgi:SOS-response transcriptional repressor LexA